MAPSGCLVMLASTNNRRPPTVCTLRELLNRLTSEGLVIAESARGFEVAPVSVDNFKELVNLRLLLECHALQRSFALSDMDWEGRVVAAHHKLSTLEKRTLAGDKRGLEVLKRYDSEFHQALLSACGSRVLPRFSTNTSGI